MGVVVGGIVEEVVNVGLGEAVGVVEGRGVF